MLKRGKRTESTRDHENQEEDQGIGSETMDETTIRLKRGKCGIHCSLCFILLTILILSNLYSRDNNNRVEYGSPSLQSPYEPQATTTNRGDSYVDEEEEERKRSTAVSIERAQEQLSKPTPKKI